LGTNGGPTAPAKGHWAYLGLGADLGCRNGGFTLDLAAINGFMGISWQIMASS